MQITDEMLTRAINAYDHAISVTAPCPRCNGKGYHHGFGETGHDPDWCNDCGGPGMIPANDERAAMRFALEAALAS